VKFVPKKSQMLGRLVQFAAKGAIVLPEVQGQKESKIILIDRVGPHVKDYKPGDFVVPRKYEIVMLRGGVNWFVIDEADIIGGVEELSMDEITIDGQPAQKPAAA
jgi:hypothetical protein